MLSNPNLPAGPNNPAPGRILRLENQSLAYDSASNRLLIYGGLEEQ